MVKFIVGKADLNISAAVRGELISLLENNADRQKIVYIVPDQFEYETEKAVYRILEKKELLRRFYEIRVTTFSRLCREILEECGEHRPLADDIVKSIIMHKSVSENKSALAALGKVAARPGFCGKMVKTISALKTAGITARDLENSLAAISKTDKKLTAEMPIMKKLHETNTLYTDFEAMLSEYVDKLDVTAMATDNIAKARCDTFDGANVFVDCFNDFTQSQLQFLTRVIRKADNVTFGFTAQLDSDCDVFRTANDHISRLRREAEENGLSVEFVTESIESRFAEDAPLRELSKHLFQTAKNRESLGQACELVRARGVYDELDYVAAKIKELTLDKGLLYNEIAVLCTNVGAYGKYVESVFKKYDIPIFLDTPEPILYQPLINLVISILNALESFSVDTVLSCVKTKFFAKPKTDVDGNEDDSGEQDDDNDSYIVLSDKDIDVFESYIYEWDLKTNHLKKQFTFKDKRAEDDRDMQTAEQVRKSVAVPLLELQKRLKKSGSTVNGAEITELLYDFLINKVGMRRAIFKRCKNEENTALDADKTALYQRLWNTLVDILNKLHKELSGVNLTIGEYADIFREICAAAALADPPQFIDCVLVGDIDRTRADNIKAAFIVGASYEAFPTPAFEAGIFSQYEIELIYNKLVHIESDKTAVDDVSQYIEKIARIADTGRREYCLNSVQDQYHLSLYRAYRAMTLPTEYLCISCPDANADGESLVRSDVFGEIISTFKNTEILNAEQMGSRFYCRTLRAAKTRYAMGLGERSDENLTLRKVLENEDGEFVKALDEIRELRSDIAYDKNGGNFSGKHTLKAPTARLLFHDKIGTTAIEKLNVCKFKYFCEFGLKIDERNKRSFTRSKRGEAIHFIFQKVLEEYYGDMDAFFALTRSELLSLSKKYLAEYRETETNNDSSEDKRTEYLFNNIANSATDVLITMQTELFARRYRPKFFELNIKSDRCEIIDNEGQPQNDPPAAEIYSEEETAPADHKSASFREDAPYLITAPLVVTLEDGTEVTVQGIVDRVDMFRAGEDENGKPIAYIRVVDYKSSVHSFDLHNAQNGINIQMLLYLFALQSANENNPTLELRPGGVNYIPSNNNGAANETLPPYRLLAMNYHESGLFIKDEVTESDLNNYTEHIAKMLESDGSIEIGKIESVKKSFEPTRKNLAERKFINDLRRDVMKKVSENLGAIFGGTIDALPTEYYETMIKPDGGEKSKLREPCEYCRFGDICRNAGKNVNRLERAKLRPKTANPDDDKTYWKNKYITEGGEE